MSLDLLRVRVRASHVNKCFSQSVPCFWSERWNAFSSAVSLMVGSVSASFARSLAAAQYRAGEPVQSKDRDISLRLQGQANVAPCPRLRPDNQRIQTTPPPGNQVRRSPSQVD